MADDTREPGNEGGGGTDPVAPNGGVDDAEFDRACFGVNRDFRTAAEAKLSAGRLMLRTFFGDDAKLALSPEGQSHPPWVEFRKGAGKRKLKPDRRRISEALQLAAWEKTVQGGFFANLDVTLREALLPLRNAKEMADGAQKAIELNWGLRQLKAWVTQRRLEIPLENDEKPAPPTPAQAARTALQPAKRAVKALGTKASRKRAARGLRELDEAARDEAIASLNAAIEAYREVIRFATESG